MKNPFAKKFTGLKIIIVGCGKVGSAICEKLSVEGHDITVIDVNGEAISRVCAAYDVMGIEGNGASGNILQEAGIAEADIVIAVTRSDELNLLCCTLASNLGKNCSTVARVRNPEYTKDSDILKQGLTIDRIINPEKDAAEEMSRLLRFPTALEINSFAHRKAELIKFKLPVGNKLCSMTVMEVMKSISANVLFCGVERGEEVYIPDGKFVLLAEDEISIMASSQNTHKFFKEIGIDTHSVKSLMIVGGSKTSYYLAKSLSETGVDVKLIEIDKDRSTDLSIRLPKVLVINGDGADESVLLEEGISDVESFVPITGLDEENIILSLFAKSFGTKKIITKINRNSFGSIINRLDLDTVVYPKYMTSESIVGYVRAKQNTVGSNIETLYHIFGDKAEAIEFNIQADSRLVGVELKDLQLKDNLLLACIERGGKSIIPRGTDKVMAGDNIIVITTHTGFHDADDILK